MGKRRILLDNLKNKRSLADRLLCSSEDMLTEDRRLE